MSKWEEWKAAVGETRPWHLISPNIEKASEEKAASRLEICNSCPHLIKLTGQCKKCGCFMWAKTRLEAAKCPVGKW
jgi:hypothetical protein